MKKQILSFAFAVAAIAAHAQNVGIGTVTPNASAQLDVTATNKGVLLPRVSLQSATDATTIATPATGLIVYNTNTGLAAGTGLYYNAGTPAAPNWLRMAGVAGGSTPAVGQVLVWNGSQYVPQTIAGDNWGTQSITLASGTQLSGSGTAASPLAFSGIATSGSAVSGTGTSASPLTINNGQALFNANALQSKAISTTAPTDGQVLVYNAGTATYVPGSPAVQVSSTTLSGNGTASSPLAAKNGDAIWNANKINGTAVSTTAPTTTGQVLIYNSSTGQYAPGTVAGDNWGTQVAAVNSTSMTGNGTANSPLAARNGDAIWNASQINSKAVDFSNAPTTGQTLVYDGTKFVPGNASINTGGLLSGNGSANSPISFGGVNTASSSPLSGLGSAASPLTINTASPVYNANSLQGRSVSSTAPSNGQVLVYNGSQYVPQTIAGDNWGTQTVATTGNALTGNGTAATPLAVNNTAALFNASQINSTAVTGTPTTGQALVFDGSSYKPTTLALVTSGSAISGNGTAASPLTVNNTSAIFNANQINGKTVDFSTAPVTGQTLVYNSTTGKFVPGTAAGDNWGTQVASVSTTTMSGNGTANSPLAAKNGDAIWNAGSLQGKTISSTAPVAGQVLVYNGSSYVPQAMIDSTTVTNGLIMSGNNISLGGSLSSNTDIPLNSKTLSFSGTGKIGIGTSSPTNTLQVVAAADPLKLTGVQAVSATDNYKPVVLASDGTVKTATTVNKMIGISTDGNQNLTTSTFNNGTPIKLTFAATDIDFNIGGIYSFNDANDEVTVSEAGYYAIEGWSGYVSNDDASNGSANNNITDNWGQGINLNIAKNGSIISGTRYIYTADMAHTAVSSSLGVNFIATIYAKTVVYLAAGDKISLSLVKALGNDARDPWIQKPTGLNESKKLIITRM